MKANHHVGIVRGADRNERNMMQSLPARLTSKLRLGPGGCWLFTRGLNEDGYGIFKWEGKAQKVHRVVWKILRGPIPEGHDVHHGCPHRHCGNIEHLKLLSHVGHTEFHDTISAINAARPDISPGNYCGNGHYLKDEDAIYFYKNRRQCRQCMADACTRYRQSKAMIL